MNLQKLILTTFTNFERVIPMILGGETKTSEKTPDFLQPLTMLVNVILAAVTIWGVVVIIKNVSEFSTAFQSQDSAGMSSAIKGFIGGLLMAGIGALLTFLGITY